MPEPWPEPEPAPVPVPAPPPAPAPCDSVTGACGWIMPGRGCSAAAIGLTGITRSSGGVSFGGSGFSSTFFSTGIDTFSAPLTSALRGGSGALLPPPPPPPPGPGIGKNTREVMSGGSKTCGGPGCGASRSASRTSRAKPRCAATEAPTPTFDWRLSKRKAQLDRHGPSDATAPIATLPASCWTFDQPCGLRSQPTVIVTDGLWADKCKASAIPF